MWRRRAANLPFRSRHAWTFSSISRSGDRIPSEVKSNTRLRWQPMCDANIGLAVYQGATAAGGGDELCRGRLQRPQAELSFNDKHHSEVGCVLLREFSARYLASRCERRELPFALIAQCDASYLSWSLAPYCFRCARSVSGGCRVSWGGICFKLSD